MENLDKPSITVAAADTLTEGNNVCVIEVNATADWTTAFINYLTDETLPVRKDEAHRVKVQSARYWLSPERILFRKSFSGPYLRCIPEHQVQEILTELHEGSCGGHSGGRSLANRARTLGYWWPFMQKDALAYGKKCDKCQRFSPRINQPATELHPFTSPWPFALWGLDIVGPFPLASGGRKFLLVATDYFTKWVEAEPLKSITQSDVRSFLWKNIVTRFGIPNALVADNGTQFKGAAIKDFCDTLGIKRHFSSVGYPQGNGQAEASNKVIVAGLKRRLEAAKGRWADELLSVLWAFRKTPRRSTGATPYSLAFGTEAIIPLEVNFPTHAAVQLHNGENDAALEANLDFVDERREVALIHLANYQNILSRHRRKIMSPRELNIGDLVLRKAMGTAVNPREGKIGPNWEGSYKITATSPTGAYYLENAEGVQIPNLWNTHNLRRYYY
jgi:hypothetical protein